MNIRCLPQNSATAAKNPGSYFITTGAQCPRPGVATHSPGPGGPTLLTPHLNFPRSCSGKVTIDSEKSLLYSKYTPFHESQRRRLGTCCLPFGMESQQVPSRPSFDTVQ